MGTTTLANVIRGTPVNTVMNVSSSLHLCRLHDARIKTFIYKKDTHIPSCYELFRHALFTDDK